MFAQSTVSEWIERLKDGRESAAENLWNHYLRRLTRLVSYSLRTALKTVSDEEDVILDACDACFRALKENRYPDVKHREDLWKILAATARRKSLDQIRRSKKGVERFCMANPSASYIDTYIYDSILDHPCPEPTPEFAHIFVESVREKLSALDEMATRVALLRMQGFKQREISKQIGRSVPTVERYLRLIRKTWSNDRVPLA